MHTPFLLRKQLEKWIQAADIASVVASVEGCKQLNADDEMAFGPVFCPTDPSDSSTLPLFAAITAGNQAITTYLLEQGCSLELRDEAGRTPLYQAFAADQLDIAELLIQRGADIMAKTDLDTRVFDMVLSSGSDQWVDWFAQRGLSMQYANKNGYTSLHYACMSANVDLVLRVQQQSGFDFLTPSDNGQRPLDLCEHYVVFQAIVQRYPQAPLNVRFSSGSCSLLAFAARGCTEIVCHLLDHGADPQQVSDSKNTVMHQAVESGNAALVSELIRRKISVEGRNRSDQRPLLWAAMNGDLPIVKLLVEQGRAKVNISPSRSASTRKDMQTPLYAAIDAGHCDAARYLVDQGAELDALSDSSHRTAVVAAAKLGDLSLLRYLLERGACANGVNSKPQNSTPDYYSFPLASAANAAVVDMLVEFGAHVNAENRHQESALRSQVEKVEKKDLKTAWGQGHFSAIEALLRHGANLRDGSGSILSAAECVEVTKLLLEAQNRPIPPAPQPVETIALEGYQSVLRELANAMTGGRYEDEMHNQMAERKRTGLGPILFQTSHDCYTPDKLEAFMELARGATAEDVNYQSLDSYYDNETILHRILGAFAHYRPDGDYAPLDAFFDCVFMLLDKGAKPNAVETLYGETCFHKAAKTSCSIYGLGNSDADERVLQLFQKLLDAQADLDVPNKNGARVVDLLAHPQLVQWLTARGAKFGKNPERQ